MDLLAAGGAGWPGAVAVSGGGDSLALMFLLARWAKARRRAPPVVLTVDHGLKENSAAAARSVMAWAKKAGLKGHVLVWKGGKPKSDIEAAARAARYRLMGDWAQRNGIAAIYLGHTCEDQAETFLLRLARGSGLDGLAAMRAHAPYPVEGFAPLELVRPLLGFARADLRADLRRRRQRWIEDAMNEETRFARVRMRGALGALEAAGLSPARIADAAAHLARAREALEIVTAAVLARAAKPGAGGILLDSRALGAAPREVGLRALAKVLMTVSGAPYRPRFDTLERLFDRIAARRLGGGATLHGCRIAPAKQRVAGPEWLLIAPENRPKSRPRPADPAGF